MSKYVDLQIECQRLWNKKVEVIPIIIGATGIILIIIIRRHLI